MSRVSDERTYASVLIVDSDIIVRHTLGAYLRDCGYRVVEAATSDEALLALVESSVSVDIILCDVAVSGAKSGFELASWVRRNHPNLEVKLAASVERAAETAADLCDDGPNLTRPYDPHSVVNYILERREIQKRNSKDAPSR
jgi:CheY-like chemotaxis protein